MARAEDLEIEVLEEGFTDIPWNEDGTVTEPAESAKPAEPAEPAEEDEVDEMEEDGQEPPLAHQKLVNNPKLYEVLTEEEIWGEKSETGGNESIKWV